MIPPKKCLSCKHFRPEDQYLGLCRIDKATFDQDSYPIMKHEDLCERWKDVGQQYYIRVGRVKNIDTRKAVFEDS